MTARILLFVLLLGLVVTPASAQTSNDTIPACTPRQVAEMAALIDGSGIMDEIAFISGRMAEGVLSDVVTIVADLDPYQRQWWNEIVPALPNCAFAYTTAHTVGRFIDDLLIGAAFTQIAIGLEQQGMSVSASLYVASVEQRMATFQAISADVGTLGSEFEALAGVSGNSGASTEARAQHIIISPSPANLRAAPNTQGDVTATLQPGASVEVLGPVTGEPVNGNSQWYEIRVNGRTLYVHSSLIGPSMSGG